MLLCIGRLTLVKFTIINILVSPSCKLYDFRTKLYSDGKISQDLFCKNERIVAGKNDT